jgi:hypothetical protein
MLVDEPGTVGAPLEPGYGLATVASPRHAPRRLVVLGLVFAAAAGAGCRGIAPPTPASATAAVCSSMASLKTEVYPPNGRPSDTTALTRADRRLRGELGPLSLGGPGTVAQQQIGEDANALTRQLGAIISGRGDNPATVQTITKLQRECRASH